MSHSLGIFGELPTDLLTHVCSHLPINDIVTVSELDDRMNMLVKNVIYKEIKGLRVEINEEFSNIYFTHKNGRVTQMSLDQSDWEDIVTAAKCIERLEFNVITGKSTSQLFNCFRNSSFKLRSYKINVIRGSIQQDYALRQRFYAIISQHRDTLRHVDISTPQGQKMEMNINSSTNSLVFSYTQPTEPSERQLGDYNMHHSFIYALMHEYLKSHQITDVTLQISSRFDSSLSLEKAFQIAIPYANKQILKRLSVEFGNSLKEVTEKEIHELIVQHIRENSFATRNLQYFHCSFPDNKIDYTKDFIAALDKLPESMRKTVNPKNSLSSSIPPPVTPRTIPIRGVKCK